MDCFRYRNKVGLDVAMEGLREGLRRRRFTSDELWRHAGTARAWSVMRPYVEAMVSNAAAPCVTPQFQKRGPAELSDAMPTPA